MMMTRSEGPGTQHIMPMLDHFQLQGPNGTHDCIVLEFLGPSVSDLLEDRFGGRRLPGKLAKTIAKQTLIGLDFLHQQNIGHGGTCITLCCLITLAYVQVRSTYPQLSFYDPFLHSLQEDHLLQKLGNPETGLIKRKYGQPLDSSMPRYLVWPSSYPLDKELHAQPIKIIDFGESFSNTYPPTTLHMPLAVRAPEVVFGDTLDHRVDLSSMGCMVRPS